MAVHDAAPARATGAGRGAAATAPDRHVDGAGARGHRAHRDPRGARRASAAQPVRQAAKSGVAASDQCRPQLRYCARTVHRIRPARRAGGGDAVDRPVQGHRHDRQRRQLGRQRDRQPGRRQRRPGGAKSRRQGLRSACRYSGHGDDDVEADHFAELAARAQSVGAGQCRRRHPAHRRPETQRRRPGEAVPRQRGAQPDQCLGNTAAQRSVHRKRGARRMGQAVPRHPARHRRGGHAEPLARSAPDPRHRRAAEDRRQRGDAAHWRAGRYPHRADRDQAGLPVPAGARSGAAGQRRQREHRRADRYSVPGSEPPP